MPYVVDIEDDHLELLKQTADRVSEVEYSFASSMKRGDFTQAYLATQELFKRLIGEHNHHGDQIKKPFGFANEQEAGKALAALINGLVTAGPRANDARSYVINAAHEKYVDNFKKENRHGARALDKQRAELVEALRAEAEKLGIDPAQIRRGATQGNPGKSKDGKGR